MIENTTTSSQMLATIPGQSFNQSLSSSEFSSFSWYKNALSTSDLVMISRSTDPFYGWIPAAIGFSKGFNISTDMRGAVGVFFKADQIETLLSPLFVNQSSGSISYSIWSPVNIYIRNGSLTQFKDEDFNSIYIQITNKSAAQWNDTWLNPVSNYEVVKSNGNYTIRDVQNKSNSGVLYKWVVVFSHSMNWTTMASISINNFQFVTILMQDITIVENFSVGLSNEIENKFIILMGIIIGSSLLLCLIIGGWVFWSTRKITSPIQKLIELTSTIKKKHKIEEIRNKVKNHELFKKFQNEEASKKDNNTEENQDEIQELISKLSIFQCLIDVH